MIIQLSNNDACDFSTLEDIIPLLKKIGPQEINIIVDAKDVAENWNWFQKSFFEASLLQVNGFFVHGILEISLKEKTSQLYANSVFERHNMGLFYKNKIDESIIPKRKNAFSSMKRSPEISKTLRTILIWNGKKMLKPNGKIILDFNKQHFATIIQVQKIFNTDFNGSNFGINQLKPGEIATTLVKLDTKVSIHYYNNIPSKGIFLLNDQGDEIKGYGIIIE